MKLRKNQDGYLVVNLAMNGAKKTYKVHRLVLLAFNGAPPTESVACHNDGDPSNNALENLRWGSESSNARDRVTHGKDYRANKTHCPWGHPLEHPNLVLGHLKRGRKCLACSRSRAFAYYRKLEPTKALADLYYDRIIQSPA